MTPSFPTQPSSDLARSYDRYRQAQVRWQSQFHLHGHSGIEMRYVVTHHFTQISKKACPAMIEPEAVALILLAAGRSTRFGVADKLAAPLPGSPLAQPQANPLSPIPFCPHFH